jgi:hypothetical protein
VRILLPSNEFLCRAGLSALLAIDAHLFRWEWLRFLTSEAILRSSAFLGMTTARVSFDTVAIQGELFQYFVSCTFADLFLGVLPFIWRGNFSPLRNLLRLALSAAAIFAFNLLRLELGQIAFRYGVPWILAHEIPSGFALFAVVFVIWQTRDWPAWRSRTIGFRLESSAGPGDAHSVKIPRAQPGDGPLTVEN